MRIQKLIIGILIATSILLNVSCAKEKDSPLPEPSTANEAPVVVPPPTPPPTIEAPPLSPLEPIHPPAPVPTPSPAPRPAPPPPFERSVTPEDAHYLPGELIEVRLTITNVSAETITFSPYPPQIRVTPRMDFDRTLFLVAGGTQPREVSPDETITFDFAWDQKDSQGQQASPGWYAVSFRDMNITQGDRGTMFHSTARVLIQHPQGAVEKTIDLNQEQTVNGITVTLERIELMVDGARFSAFFIPPAYTPPPAGPGLPPAPVVTARAEYSFSGVTRNAGTAGFSTKDSGMRLVWGIGMHKLDPVPSDATELVFTITQLNDWQGPWEFKVPLE